MCRLAINHNCMSDALIQLSAIVGFEGVPLHLTYFPKLWLEIYTAVVSFPSIMYVGTYIILIYLSPEKFRVTFFALFFQQLDKKFISVLLSNNFFIDYVETILLDERTSLNVPVIYKFLSAFFPKVYNSFY